MASGLGDSKVLVAMFLAFLFMVSPTCAPVLLAQQSTPSATSGLLTVERIYGEPSLNGHLSRGVEWAPDNRRLSYLESSGSGKERHTALWVMDLGSSERSVLIPADKLENLLPTLPRKDGEAGTAVRSNHHAPVEYLWAPSGEALLLSDANSLAWFDLETQSGRVLVTGAAEIGDAKISPDGKFVSFLRNHNLWLVSNADGEVRQLTKDGSEGVRKGELDWVYPEELDITTAYWWAPDSSAVAFLEMDERPVSQFSLVNFESFTGNATLQRYPVAGGKNPAVHVYVASVGGGQPRLMDTGVNTDIYIPRVNWLPDSKRVAIQRLNREQTTLDLLVADAATGKSSVLLTDKDPYWINVSDDLHFFKDGKRFLWSSERSGYRHLYLYDMGGKQLAQVTRGEWEVRHVSAVDEGNDVVYFIATEKSPLEHHLYRVVLDGSALIRLSEEEGVHAVQFSPSTAFYLDTYSNATTPPRQDLYRAGGTKFASFNENKVNELSGYHLSPVEFFTVQSHDNVSLNCYMIKPPHFDAEKQYPVITFVYGGPGVQVVLNGWAGEEFLWHELMAQKGYIVFAMDNRGSAGRGHVFEEPIHYRFGAQELSDQRDGAAWLRLQPYVDRNRMGIWGWSYGGHMTLHAMFEAPEIYKVGFSVAPVTDWHFYDTIYTERYIGLPDTVHEESYQESSPIKNAAGLKGKLLIAHGSGDDNVHYSNTLALVDELIKAGKYVEVMSFPGRSHGIADPAARKILFSRATQFFLDNL
jgi:dipeptidyl-peptidase-4